jgi:hypothetical protein
MEKDEWLTPPSIIKALGQFDLDPCAPITRPWPTAENHLTILDDGLSRPWNGRVYCNPPYGRATGRWLARCAEHGNATADWIEHVRRKAHSILFLFGRLYFHHVDGTRATSNSGAPSALISYDEQNTLALERSNLPGYIVTLR